MCSVRLLKRAALDREICPLRLDGASPGLQGIPVIEHAAAERNAASPRKPGVCMCWSPECRVKELNGPFVLRANDDLCMICTAVAELRMDETREFSILDENAPVLHAIHLHAGIGTHIRSDARELPIRDSIC